MFKHNMIVESYSNKTAQALVFFGREKTLGVRVVLKQFAGSRRKASVTELKIFTQLEGLRQQQTGNELSLVLTKK